MSTLLLDWELANAASPQLASHDHQEGNVQEEVTTIKVL